MIAERVTVQSANKDNYRQSSFSASESQIFTQRGCVMMMGCGYEFGIIILQSVLLSRKLFQ